MLKTKKISSSLFIVLGILLPITNAWAESSSALSSLNPLGNMTGGAPELFGRVIRLLLGFTGVAALVFFIWGGILLLISRGNQDKIKSGRDTIIWAVVGMMVAFSSYIVLSYIIRAVITREA